MSNDFALTLPALTLKLSEGVHVAGTLPLPTLDCLIHSGSVFTMSTQFFNQGQLPFPMTLVASFQGLTAAPELPALVGGGITGTVPNLLRAASTLPALVAGTIGGTITGLGEVAGTLPLPTVVLLRGSAYAPVLPVLQGTALITVNPVLGFALAMPALRGAVALDAPSQVLNALLILPALISAAGGSVDVAPRLPALHGSAVIVAGTQALRQAWVMNAANMAVTQFSNFPFRAFARAYERYYGVGLDGGLHLMGGDKDITAPISWQWRTGLSDVGSRAGKGVLALYVDGIAERGCEFEVITDRGDYWYMHQPHGTPNDHQTQRVSIGKALRSVNWSFGMRSTKGAYFEIDALAPEWQISDRNLF